jgi:sugar phosphate isomerase/epimerase
MTPIFAAGARRPSPLKATYPGSLPMIHPLPRRDFLKTTALLGTGMGLLGLRATDLLADQVAKGAPNAEKLGWRLGCQAYSFNRSTFFEAVDKNAALGLHYIEGFPNQKISKTLDAKLGPALSADQRKEVKQKLADAGVKLVNYGVGPCDRQTFDFAKDMGIETLVSEPKEEVFDEINKLVDEYAINVAIHNHPNPSHYWNPDTVLAVTKGRSKRIGACADTGHWMRSGLNPVECLQKLEGRIISFHFKDLNKVGTGEPRDRKKKEQDGPHDVPWGTGVGNAKAMLAEIHRQGIKAVFSIEYEYNWENSVPEIAQCVQYFDQVAAELASKS